MSRRLKYPNYNEPVETFFNIWRPQHQIDQYFFEQEAEQKAQANKRRCRSREFERAYAKGQVDDTNDWHYNKGKWEVVK